MFFCSLKIIDHGPLFSRSDFQNFHVPCFSKLVLFPCSLKNLRMFPCFLEMFWCVPLFPDKPRGRGGGVLMYQGFWTGKTHYAVQTLIRTLLKKDIGVVRSGSALSCQFKCIKWTDKWRLKLSYSIFRASEVL